MDISGNVYDALANEAKISNNGRSMWEERKWNAGPIERIFRSNWTWTPPSDR